MPGRNNALFGLVLASLAFGCQENAGQAPQLIPSEDTDTPAYEAPPADESAAAPSEATVPAPSDTPAASSDTAIATPSGDEAVGSWPRFHGPRGDNISDETGLLTAWPEEGPPLVWKTEEIGFGYSGVALAGGLIYTSGNIDGRSVITALRPNGEVAWQADNGPGFVDEGRFPGTRGTPTIDGEVLFDESPVGQVGCFRAADGEQVWSRNILEEFGAPNIKWALSESLLIDGDRLIASPGGPKTAVVALDKQTGETVWQSATAEGDMAGYCSPTLVEYQGLRMIFVMTGRALIGVDADNGSLLFRFPHKTQYDVNVEKPIFRDGMLYVTSGYGTGSVMLKLTVDGKKVQVEEAWRNKRLDNHHGGVLLLGDYIYGTGMRGKWVCLDWNTGQLKLEARALGKGSLTCAEGLIYLFTEKRRVGLVKPNPNEYEELSRFEIPKGGEGASWAHPVVCGGRLYLRHGDQLFAYDVRAK